MGTVDDPTVIVGARVGLSSEFETKVLDDVSRGAGERLSHAAQVDNDGLDAVALAFDLGLDALHLVAVEGVGDIAANVDGSHGDGGAGGLVDEVDLVIMRRAGERGRIRYVDEGRKRHAQEQSLVCVGCVCATQGQEGQWISRWFGG